MSDMVAFLPCRAGSMRVPLKNTRCFAGVDGGLLRIKIDQLSQVDGIDEVVVDSNDPLVLELAERQRATWPASKRLTIRRRPDDLGRSETSTDELIAYALDTLDGRDLLWTHVTSPLVDAAVYDRAIAQYAQRDLSRHDSLMSVHRIQAFLWNDGGAINYDRETEKWPRTQTLAPCYEVDSAIFLVPFAVARLARDRIGSRPRLFELSKIESVDVDWEEDFRIAEMLYASKNAHS